MASWSNPRPRRSRPGILELAADPARRRSMGLAARAKAETYSHSHSAAAFERVALGVLDLD